MQNIFQTGFREYKKLFCAWMIGSDYWNKNENIPTVHNPAK
jgi:hypothetical protein